MRRVARRDRYRRREGGVVAADHRRQQCRRRPQRGGVPVSRGVRAVDASGGEVTFNPGSTARPAPTTIDATMQDDGFKQVPLNGVACPSTTQCTAVDNAGNEITFDPARPGTPQLVIVDRGRGLRGIACPSVAQCTALDRFGSEVTFDPGNPGAASTAVMQGSDPERFQGLRVACPSVTQRRRARPSRSRSTGSPRPTIRWPARRLASAP
jgi:hypothetical protein